MSFRVKDNLKYYTFDTFPQQIIRHGVFTRRGGVSPTPWNSLNVGGTVGDEKKRVLENRERVFQGLEIEPSSIFDSWQVHGNSIIRVETPLQSGDELTKADGLVTNKKNIALMMRFADCVPIFLIDPVQQAVGLAHAGWKGTLLNIAADAVRQMEAQFNSNSVDILAGIGPSIGPDHYEVGEELVAGIKARFQNDFRRVVDERNDRIYFNLWEANRILLNAAGVQSVEVAGECTACHLNDWYSHRAEEGQTGRFAALIQWVG